MIFLCWFLICSNIAKQINPNTLTRIGRQQDLFFNQYVCEADFLVMISRNWIFAKFSHMSNHLKRQAPIQVPSLHLSRLLLRLPWSQGNSTFGGKLAYRVLTRAKRSGSITVYLFRWFPLSRNSLWRMLHG